MRSSIARHNKWGNFVNYSLDLKLERIVYESQYEKTD